MPLMHIDLKGLKPCKALRPDMIPTYLVKQLAHQLAPALTLIYQVSLDQGQLPEDWKTVNVIPVFKKAIRSHLSNYIDLYHLPAYATRSWSTSWIIYSNVLHHLQEQYFMR